MSREKAELVVSHASDEEHTGLEHDFSLDLEGSVRPLTECLISQHGFTPKLLAYVYSFAPSILRRNKSSILRNMLDLASYAELSQAELLRAVGGYPALLVRTLPTQRIQASCPAWRRNGLARWLAAAATLVLGEE